MEKILALTGHDSQTCRTLYATNVTFRPTFTLFCQCNEFPGLEKVDDATRRRIDCVPFNHKFCFNPTLPHEKPIDTSLKDKINSPLYYTQFLKILIEHIKPKIDQQLLTPEIISNRTKNYFDDNNDIRSFLDEFYELTDKNDKTKENFMSLKDMYDHYRENGGEY